ncbi:MAG: NHL repeat-containing protein, partial [Leptospiraceae bacterium]|nr:NHL repeat-containing protein [Leptospiraceae bacterium]
LGFYNRQNYVAAREFFYKALDVHPYFHLARRYLGDSYYYSGDFNGALEQWSYLQEVSRGAYPTVGERLEILEFHLNQYSDPGEQSYLRKYDSSTFRRVPLDYPVDVAVDSRNRQYLINYRDANIVQLSADGTLLNQFKGPFYDPLKGPIAAIVHDDLIYVADYDADEISVFRTSGARLRSFGESGSGDGQFRGPSGLVVESGYLFVCDAGNGRIEKFDLEGNFLASLKSRETRLHQPSGIAGNGRGILYISDKKTGIIHVMDIDGNMLDSISSPELQEPRGLEFSGNRLWIADEKAGVLFYDAAAKSIQRMTEIRDFEDRPVLWNRVFSVRSDSRDSLLISDYGAHQVVMTTPEAYKRSGLNIKLQKVDVASFPVVGLFVQAETRDGKALPGLSRKEIFVYENDRRIGGVRTDNMEPYQKRTNIVVVKENSEKLRSEGLDEMIPSVLQPMLLPLSIVDRFKLVRSGEQSRLIYEGRERKQILKLMSTGETATAPSLGMSSYFAISELVSEIGPRGVVLVVSGAMPEDTFSPYGIDKIVQYARAQQVQIHVVSFEQDRDLTPLYQDLAHRTGGEYLRAFDETALKNLYAKIRNHTDSRYILTYDSLAGQSLKDRYVDVRVEVHFQNTSGVGDGGFFVPGE